MTDLLPLTSHPQDVGSPAPEPARTGDRHRLADLFGDVAHRLTVAQLGRLTTGLLWLAWAMPLAQAQAQYAPLLGTFIAAAAIACMGAAIAVHGERGRRTLDGVLLSGTLALIVVVPLVIVGTAQYSTDELAIDQSAASSVLHGANPYTTDYSSAFNTYGVYHGQTMRLDGTSVSSVSYPALSFLLYVPAVALFGAKSYAGIFVDLVAWAIAAWMLWRTLGDPLRHWVPPLVLLPTFLGAVQVGLTDSLYIPFELIAVSGWSRFTDRDTPALTRLMGPVALGVACAIKQPAWLLVPFLVAGIAIEARSRRLQWRRPAVQYAGIVAAAFLLPNLGFIVAGPHAWLRGVLVPLTGGLVPMGIGPASLLRPYSIGGGNLELFGVASAAAFAGTLLLFVLFYPTFRRLIPLVPAVVLFLSTRSFETYFTFCIPALLVNVATLPRAPVHALSSNVRRVLGVAAISCLTIAGATVISGVLIPAPLQIAVTSSTASQTALHITATVRNVGQQPLRPTFFLGSSQYFNQTVVVQSGPRTLAAGATASYVFSAMKTAGSPRVGDSVQLQAGTSNPDAIASSNVVTLGAAAP